MLIIAHRGAGAYSPHNSRQGFFQAIALGANMIETDVRVSQDNVPVICHDPLIPWGPIAHLKWEEIKRYPLGNGETILSLEELLIIFGRKIKFNLEIKPEALGKIDSVFNIIKKNKPIDPLISSFSVPIVKKTFQATSYETGLLLQKNLPLEELLKTLSNCKISTLNLHYSLLNKEFAKTIKQEGYQLIVWADFLSEIWDPRPLYTQAYKFGSDGFITGKPDLLKQWLHFLNNS